MSSDIKIRLSGTVVTLPSSKTMRMADALILLSITRETVRLWRDRGFPATIMDGKHGYLVVDQVAVWLAANDVKVVRK